MWLEGSGTDGDLPDDLFDVSAAIMERAFAEWRQRREDTRMTGGTIVEGVGEVLGARILAWLKGGSVVPAALDVDSSAAALLKRVDPEGIWSAMGRMAEPRKGTDELLRQDVDAMGLSDELLSALVATRLRGAFIKESQRRALRREIASLPDGPDLDNLHWERVHQMGAALGSSVNMLAMALRLKGMTPSRALTVLDLLSVAPDPEPGMSERYRDMLRRMENPLVAQWLADAFLKIDSGVAPFSYNPLSAFNREALLGVCVDVAHLAGDPDAAPVVGGMIADMAVMLAATSFKRDELGESKGGGADLPMVRRVLERWSGRYDQLLLYAALNGTDQACVVRLRDAFESSVQATALRALRPFANPALETAAS